MQATILKEKTALHDTKMAAMKAFWAKRGDDYTLSNDEKQEIDKLNKEATDLITEITELKEFKEAYEKAEAFQKLIHAPLGSPDLPGGDPRTRIQRERPESVAQKFVNDPNFKAWLQTVAPNGAAPSQGIRLSDSPLVEAKSLVFSSTGSAGRRTTAPRRPNADAPNKTARRGEIRTGRKTPTTSQEIDMTSVARARSRQHAGLR